MSDDIKFEVVWTDLISDDKIKEFLGVFSCVFDVNESYIWFKKKYINNPYGRSLIVFAYYKGSCVAVRSLLRYDINSFESYQPCDTAVLKEFRKLGLFSKMTRIALCSVSPKALIYNFPNDNSLPGYLKLGWKYEYKRKYFPFISFLGVKNIPSIDVRWIGSEPINSNIFSISFFNKKYLIKKIKIPFCYVIIGSIDEDDFFLFKKINFGFLFSYVGAIGFGRGVVCVAKNEYKQEISISKIDTFL